MNEKFNLLFKYQKLYYHPKKVARIANKRLRAVKKKCIAELKKKPKTGQLLCLDTIVKNINNQRRYIVTAIDKHSKLAYARMYKFHSSACTKDFLVRLNYLLNGKIEK